MNDLDVIFIENKLCVIEKYLNDIHEILKEFMRLAKERSEFNSDNKV